jgi:alpha-glucosidase
VSVEEIRSGNRFRFEQAALELVFLAPDLARLSWEPGTPPIPYALARTEWPEINPETRRIEAGYTLTTQGLSIAIHDDGGLEFSSPAGQTLRCEKPPLRQGETWTHCSILRPDECLYGLGEQAGSLNLRRFGSPDRHRLWNTDPGGSYGRGADPLYMPLPVFHGLHHDGSYMVFHENYHAGEWKLTPPNLGGHGPGTLTVQFEGGMLREYFFSGTPVQTLTRFTELTGRAPLPPHWSLGYHQCRWGYRTEAEIRNIVAGFREHHLPLEAIHLDIDYMDGFRVFTVDKQRFPDLKKLAEDLDNLGVKLITIFDPGVKIDQAYPVYRQGIEQDVFCKLPDGKVLRGLVWPGWSAFPDFTNPKTRLWWGEFYLPFLQAGVSGFWHDMNEPTSFTISGDMTLPLATQHDLDGQVGDHIEAHNLYALLMNRAAFDALQKLNPERRPWLFSRSGWVGQQRYAWSWTADTESTWEGLRLAIPTVLGLGLSGIPFAGPDIGGFNGNPSGELYLRWFQLAALLPYFRTHSAIGTSPREPWVFGEPYTSIIRHFMRLRQRLMPYLYTLAWEAGQSGLPLVRPLFWKCWDQSALWEIDDSYLLGEDMLVVPILEKGLSRRKITLPPGIWYSFWDDSRYEGPGEIQVDAELETIPIFIRAGTLLSTQEDGRLVVHLYAQTVSTDQPESGRTPLYSDAGDGYGDYRIDFFSLTREDSRIILSREDQGKYPFPYTGVELELHSLLPRKATLDGRQLAVSLSRFPVGTFNQLVLEV